MTTSKLSTQLSFADSGLLPEDTLASLFPKPASDEARKMTVTSGLRCLESYVKPDPLMSCVKMLLATSRWASTQCYLIWKEKVTPANRLLFQLSPKMPNIDETGSGFWLTPTAVQMEPTEGRREKRKAYRESIGRKDVAGCLAGCLAEQVATPKMWPTPRASEYKDVGPVGSKSHTHMDKKGYLCAKVKDPEQPKGSLNPDWVEHYLMGYPLGWTNLTSLELESESRTEPKD